MSSWTKVQEWPPLVVVVTQGVGEAIEPLLFAVLLYFHEKRLQIMAWAVTRASKTRAFVGRSTNARWKHGQVPPEPLLFQRTRCQFRTSVKFVRLRDGPGLP